MTRPSKWSRTLAAISQLICVVLVNGDEDEMLSSYAYRTNNQRLIAWLDWIFGQGHCKESYLWEKLHYNLERFKDA